MSDVRPDELLESVVRITGERNRDSLEISLVAAMLEVLPVRELALLKRLPEGPDQIEEVIRLTRADLPLAAERLEAGGPHRPIFHDPFLDRCLEQGEVVHDRQGTERLRVLFPIALGGRPVAVLEALCAGAPPGGQALVRSFLRIYENYLTVLNDNEHDTLTGLRNRKTFDSNISRILGECEQPAPRTAQSQERRRPGQPAGHWLGVLDIDRFKQINDSYGHLYGDEVLLLFAQLMRRNFRSNDLLFRYGGEEFVVVLAPAEEADALQAFERFREAVAAYDFPQVGRVTVSIGMVGISVEDQPATVVGRADQALYYAKSHGRDRVCHWEKLVTDGALQPPQHREDVELF